MKRQQALRRGFTLIELLVVVIIIVILSGMLFKISRIVTDKAERSSAIADMENLRNALTEYYAEYGMYPPTTENSYVYESVTNQPTFLQNYFAARNTPGAADFVTDADFRTSAEGATEGTVGYSTVGAIGYEYGLVSHLWARSRGDQAHWYDNDLPRDEDAKFRWAHYLEEINLHESSVSRVFQLQESSQPYTNTSASVRDPWGNDYHYSSTAPYQSYSLWSSGPTANSADDIGNDSYTE